MINEVHSSLFILSLLKNIFSIFCPAWLMEVGEEDEEMEASKYVRKGGRERCVCR